MADIPATSHVLLETDSSKDFLDALLGQGWADWGQNLGGEAGQELMLEIFGAFNSVALAVISALFVWVSALAVTGTAHEGVSFGKKYSSLWMPVRFVGSMGALAPIFKGLSLFQIAVLACIGWSINLGNYVWELGTDYFVETGGQLSVQAPDQSVPAYNNLANGVIKSLTYQYYMKDRRDMDIEPGGSWEYKSKFLGGGEYVFKFNGNLGSITIDCDDADNSVCISKTNAVTTAIENLSETASKLVNPDVPGSDIDSSALSKASANIHKKMLLDIQSYAANSDTFLHQKLQAFQDMADQYGWFMAGSSYWVISWINQEVRDAMYSGIEYHDKSISDDEMEGMTYGLSDWPATLVRLNNYIATGYTDRKGVDFGVLQSVGVVDKVESKKSWLGSIAKFFSIREFINKHLPRDLLSFFIEKLATNDPIRAISAGGDLLIGSSWVIGGALTGLHVASLDKLGPIVSFLLFSLFLPLMLYGITLAYYLPAIPFLKWISALAGWVILVVESLVAAPLWIAAHALPEGEGAAGQHGRRGYMLLLAILLRPPLMVAGFFCAIILINIMGRLLGKGFMLFFDSVAQTKTLGITGTISMIVILGITVIMLANKFFSLIHYLPEHVTKWIGQQMQNLGEKEDQAGAKNVFVGSTNAMPAAGSGIKKLSDERFAELKSKRENTTSPAGGGGSIFPASNLERSLASVDTTPTQGTGQNYSQSTDRTPTTPQSDIKEGLTSGPSSTGAKKAKLGNQESGVSERHLTAGSEESRTKGRGGAGASGSGTNESTSAPISEHHLTSSSSGLDSGVSSSSSGTNTPKSEQKEKHKKSKENFDEGYFKS